MSSLLKLARETQDDIALGYVMAEKRLANFVKAAWAVLEPNTELKWNWHLDLVCEELEAVTYGLSKRLIINIPPRNAKSFIVSVCWPVWNWVQQTKAGNVTMGPTTRMLFTTYAQALSSDHSMKRRTLIFSEWFQHGWGGRFHISADANRQAEFANDERGHMISTSMGGTATGRGGNILVVDDPHDTTSAASEPQRVTDCTDFDQKFTSRLDDKAKGAIVIVMQRLHEGDLTGHVTSKENGNEWRHIRLPAYAEENQVLIFPLSRVQVTRLKGDILHPEREGEKELRDAKLNLGSRAFAGQYQQRPVAIEGGVFKRAWFQLKRKAAFPAMDVEIQSWDFAVKGKNTSDFVCGLVLARKGTDRYVLDMVHDRMDFPTSCKALESLSQRHPRTYKKVVEDKANGPAIIATVKNTVTGIVAVNPEGDKMQRANAISPEVEAGNWILPSDAPWLEEFFAEMCNFPLGKHDDIVDAFTQGALVLKKSGKIMGIQTGHGGYG